jgi:hypothetical protein
LNRNAYSFLLLRRDVTLSLTIIFFAVDSSASVTESIPRFWVVSGGVMASTAGGLGDSAVSGVLITAFPPLTVVGTEPVELEASLAEPEDGDGALPPNVASGPEEIAALEICCLLRVAGLGALLFAATSTFGPLGRGSVDPDDALLNGVDTLRLDDPFTPGFEVVENVVGAATLLGGAWLLSRQDRNASTTDCSLSSIGTSRILSGSRTRLTALLTIFSAVSISIGPPLLGRLFLKTVLKTSITSSLGLW